MAAIIATCFFYKLCKNWNFFIILLLIDCNFIFSFSLDGTSDIQISSANSFEDSSNTRRSILQSKEQYYESIRKSSSQLSDPGNEKIPEYSTDIYPYATFHPNQQNIETSKHFKNLIYETSNTISISNMKNGKKYEAVKKQKRSLESEENDSFTDDSRDRPFSHCQTGIDISIHSDSTYL